MALTGALSTGQVVLVVDDEPVVLNTVSKILARAGFLVLTASSGEQALRVGRDHGGPIDLILTDVIMPGLSGPRLAESFLESHPETQALFMAGLPDQPEVAEFVLARGQAFLPKPFVPGTLVSKVRELLTRPDGRASAAKA